MLRLFLAALLLVAICFCPALSTYGDSAFFPMDTIDPELQLLSPLGGEEWYIGESKSIIWLADDANFPANPISLSYSTNGGLHYHDLALDIANTGVYNWLVTTAQSDLARVLIIARDSFGNRNTAQSPQNFSLLYAPPMPPANVTVDTSNGLDALISWEPVTLTMPPSSLPITPDGYIVLYNETPYEGDSFFYFLGRSFNTHYTHHDVMEFRDQMYYRVVAYKNYSREEDQALEDLLQRSQRQELKWDELRAILKGVKR
jgi:hypothetical protein